MSRYSTFPTLYDELKTLNISLLNKQGFIKHNLLISGILTWTVQGEKVCSISISAINRSIRPHINLNYTYQSKQISYNVQLVPIPSNLGKGVIWYFICPATQKRCRKLYLLGGYFYHRTAFKGCMYEKQTYSHNIRTMGRQFDQIFGSDKAYEKIYSKYFKKTYKGKNTKKYQKLLNQISISEKIPLKRMAELMI